MTFERLTGSAAERALGDETFVAAWSSLLAACPWATNFQCPAFVRTWYAHYAEDFEPTLYAARDDAGTLAGLLTVAAERATGRFVVAGDGQAEYHAWLARPEDGDAFIVAAMSAFARERTNRPLRFRYLPPNVPLDWTRAPEAARRCALAAHDRPLYVLGDGSDARRSLKKNTNRKRRRVIEELGSLELRHVSEPAEIAACLKAMIPMHDARHASLRGATPFRDDVRKRDFYLALLADPTLLHMSALYAGETLVAAHVGLRTGADLQFGLLAHDPTVARSSPGKFLIYYLALRLIEEGVERFDLTPGGEAYKERFSNDRDVVHTLDVHRTSARRCADSIRGAIVRRARAFAESRGVSRDASSALFHSTVAATSWLAGRDRLTANRRASGAPHAQLLYRATVGDLPRSPPPDVVVRHNDLAAWLDDAEPLSRWARRRFFAAAARRMEFGQRGLSISRDGRLQLLAWVEAQATPTHPDSLPFVAGIVFREIVATGADDARDVSAAVSAAIGDAHDSKLAVCVVCDARDDRLRRALEQIGFANAGVIEPSDRFFAPEPPDAETSPPTVSIPRPAVINEDPS